MRGKEIKNIGLRVDMETDQKLRCIARDEWRIINGQVYYLPRNCVLKLEKEHGPVPLGMPRALNCPTI